MCGIAGFFCQSEYMNHPQVVLGSMADQMAHRGPDDAGTWYDNSSGIGLAHRRLSIIDLSCEGHQPMHSISGRYTIVFNGEIYNFQDIRANKAFEDIKWRGNSDTEVLLAAIETWGVEKTLDCLNGMFAFALWDHQERSLFLVRDPMGKKPLYYGFNNKILFFASELKALKAHPKFKPDIDRNVVSLLLRHSYIPAPYSIYKGIHKLLPGSFCRISLDDIRQQCLAKVKKYWDLNQIAVQGIQNQFIGSHADLENTLEDILLKAVSRRMISDVPLGAFLSGGIDSSLIVALMQKISSKPVKTFTIGFESKTYDEADSARKIAAHLRTDHTELFVSPEQALEVIPKLPRLFDEPFADSSQIPTYLVSKMTRNHVTVALSGDGGDEMFAGYNRHFWGRHLFEKMNRFPSFLRKGTAGLINTFSPETWNNLFSKMGSVLPEKYRQTMPGDKLSKLSAVLNVKDRKQFYYDLTSWWKNPKEVMINAYEPKTVLNSFDDWFNTEDFTHLMQMMDMLTYLPDDILTKVDRSSMGASLEARAPFLDRDVVEFSWQIPLNAKISRHEGKIILKQLLYKYIPEQLVNRPKSGFGIPLDTWLRHELFEWASDLLSPDTLRAQGYFNSEFVSNTWSAHLSGQNNYQYHIWNILMFQAWLEEEKKYGSDRNDSQFFRICYRLSGPFIERNGGSWTHSFCLCAQSRSRNKKSISKNGCSISRH
ncbi:MAG: asparagine synthase (glutamine-hydrolyzing) [Desulfobacteraceae bacterium]|nr:asparagine synthase (glutamine-hydrolyzing) [Desulfobacteraceae bacterium]